MKRKRFSEEQIIGILKEHEAENAKLKRLREAAPGTARKKQRG